MFVQIIKGKVNDPATFNREAERWSTDLKPGATGYLGTTWGVAADNTAFVAARFESEAAARANSERPEQGEWWAGVESAFDDVSFQDCAEVDLMMGGGSDEAGFVQVIEGRVKDQAAARAMLTEMDGRLAEMRPDILGGAMAWHGDDGTFTQLVYFRSEADAHTGESATSDTEVDNEYQNMMATEPSFIDLTEPHFD